MEVTDALTETAGLVDGLIAGLTPEHREMETPCEGWTVHDLINHMVNTSKVVAAMASADTSAIPADGVDHLANGPLGGWNDGRAAIIAAATSENLEAMRETPFGEMPGATVVSVGVADLLTHGWDLARATGQSIAPSDELVAFGHQTWEMLIQPEARNGDAFGVEQPCADDASALDKLAAFTGRRV